MVTLIAPYAGKSFAANIVITKHQIEPDQTLENFAGQQLQLMRDSLSGFDLLDYRAVTINQRQCFQQLHRFQGEQDILQQVQTFVLAGKHIYAVTGTAVVTEFENYVEAFRQTVENLQIGG